MPKRKSDEDDYDYLEKQLRKLKRRIKSRRNRRRDSSLSSCSDGVSLHDPRECESIANVDNDVIEPEPGCSYWNDYWPVPDPSDGVDDFEHPAPAAAKSPPPVAAAVPVLTTTAATLPSAVVVTGQSLAPASVPALTAGAIPPLVDAAALLEAQQLAQAAVETPNATIDPDLLAILGEDPTVIKEYGDDIQSDLAIRLNHLATSGLTKESRAEIKDKYLIPGNCKMIKAPILNPEIRASLIESQAKRDKGIENKQVLNSCALSSLSKAITLLITSDSKNQEVLRLLMDTARILSDIQHSDSMLRRFFILSTVKKELKDQLEKTKIEDLLFGSNLVETLKSAKTISKTGADMRSSGPTNTKDAEPKQTKMINKALNGRGPPANRRPHASGGTRNWRSANPAATSRQTTTRHRSHSRTSPRHQYTRHRR
ncbi:uncharacterized protein LOC133533531 [Cydia pomonella]|uniref:uncharacterized protein LOC133533531 n=1 Tax=Cydia pomonella TaxID=82600 RepID=UPI002ADE598E|nr:uncharacterized protein LOC133533531 [Cydia pomonella]